MENESIVISLEEAKKRKYKVQHTYNNKCMFFFSPACNPDPENVKYIKEQWENVGKENELPEEDRRATVLLAAGKFVFGCGEWVVNTNDFTNDFAMVLFDGKNQPFVLQGMVDTLKVGIACNKKWPKSIEDIEKLKQKYLVSEKGEKEENEERQKAEEILDGYKYDGSTVTAFFSYWNTEAAWELLRNFSSESSYATNVVYVYQTFLIEQFKDWLRLKYLSECLQDEFPEYRAYWDEKLALANEKIENNKDKLKKKGYDYNTLRDELANKMVEALDKVDNDEIYHTLAFDCNAVYGRVLLSMDTKESYEENLKRYGDNKDLKIRFALGDFSHVDVDDINLIDYNELKECFEDMNIAVEIMMYIFIDALFVLVKSEAFNRLNKTKDFTVICMDHDETYETSLKRMRMLRGFHNEESINLYMNPKHIKIKVN